MTDSELEQLELLARVDELVERLARWAEPESAWEPMGRCRALVRRLLSRVETLRVRLEAPLIVAMFGGTGTGKSTLVNALVGQDCTKTGRQRPTTTKPVLIAHPETQLEACGLPLDDFEITRVNSPILRDIAIIDCPDPDTTEAETAGSNLERLHRLLPFCDVLIYTSTQQKYRSARVTDELGQAATGCRLLFVQTHADVDDDIRDDWRKRLTAHYDVPEMFFLDSQRALRDQQDD
ncbi:MAG: GTPase, partial [Planctomycetaceae bacterium]